MKKIIQLPSGERILYMDYIPACPNCGMDEENAELCSACIYLLTGPTEYVGQIRSNGETEKFFNRRWQTYFNRGYLTGGHVDKPLWIDKRSKQQW